MPAIALVDTVMNPKEMLKFVPRKEIVQKQSRPPGKPGARNLRSVTIQRKELVSCASSKKQSVLS